MCSQRALAEVTEMIRTSHLVHKGLVNIYPEMYPEPAVLNDMTFGNKIALLSGDYLLGNSCTELAALRNQDVSHLVLRVHLEVGLGISGTTLCLRMKCF